MSTSSATRDRDGRPLRTTICRMCGLVWSNPRPGEEEVRRYYSREYRLDYKGQRRRRCGMSRAPARGALNRYRDLAPFLKTRRLACWMRAPAAEKWCTCCAGSASTRWGSNLTSSTRATRARRSACPSRPASSRIASFPAGRFDVVTMYHALEHVEDPVGILTTLRGWLLEGGVLLVEVPNVEARCIHPRHRFHFAHFYNFNRGHAGGARAGEPGFEPVQTTTSADGGNLISVFRAAGVRSRPRPRMPGNYARVCRHCARAHAGRVLFVRRRRMPARWAGCARS